jgi:hypothetical protein
MRSRSALVVVLRRGSAPRLLIVDPQTAELLAVQTGLRQRVDWVDIDRRPSSAGSFTSSRLGDAGSRRFGFWGDYLYVSAVPGAVSVAWTDSRDLVPGADPREVGEDDDEDGFDVYQPCVYVPNDIDAPSYSSPTIDDPCLSQGGLDQNIYAARIR